MESRESEFSAPSDPRNRKPSEASTTTIPQTEGRLGIWRSVSRRAQRRYPDRIGTRKPCP